MFTFREATAADVLLYFEWANDDLVRLNSINTAKIDLEAHKKWFAGRLENPATYLLVFLNDGVPAGQVRLEKDDEKKEVVINYSIDKNFRGKGLGTRILEEVYHYYTGINTGYPLTGLVKPANAASNAAFIRAGYNKEKEMVLINNEAYFKYSKQ